MSPHRDVEADAETRSSDEEEDQPRNKSFGSRNPFSGDSSLSLLGATGSWKFFNATSAQYSWSGWNESEDHEATSPERRNSEHMAPPATTGGRPRQQKKQQQQKQQPQQTQTQNEPQPSDQHLNDDERENEGHFPARRKDDVLSFVWRSRDNRKGRHALVLRRGEDGKAQPHGTLEPTNTLPATIRGIVAMFTRFPYWDISWWVAIVFALGSLVWVANGFTVLLPQIGKDSSQAMTNASSWSAFAGAFVFLMGSFLLVLEAVNANRSGCFGWAVEQGIKGTRLETNVHPGGCEHHYHSRDEHEERKEAREEEQDDDESIKDTASRDEEEQGDQAVNGWRHRGSREHILAPDEFESMTHSHAFKWIWWPSWHDLRTYFFYEIGFLACCIQFFSAWLFWLSKFSGLPGISEHVSQSVMDGTHWAPQVFGCLGFITSSILFMTECQQYWYLPAPSVLGWHVGFWKLVGCIGFLLSAVMGLLGQHGMDFAEKQSSISSFWGSWAILIGSLFQWYESLDKYPVVEEGTSRYSEWNERFIKESEKRRDGRDPRA